MDPDLKKDLFQVIAGVLGAVALFLIILVFSSCGENVYIMGYNEKFEKAEGLSPADSLKLDSLFVVYEDT